MKKQTIQEIEELLKKITPGEWVDHIIYKHHHIKSGIEGIAYLPYEDSGSDAAFIVMAPTIARMMLAYRIQAAYYLALWLNGENVPENEEFERIDKEIEEFLNQKEKDWESFETTRKKRLLEKK